MRATRRTAQFLLAVSPYAPIYEARGVAWMRDRGPTKPILERVRAEFIEMPGLRLKLEQVQRLCGVDRAVCQHVLDSQSRWTCSSFNRSPGISMNSART